VDYATCYSPVSSSRSALSAIFLVIAFQPELKVLNIDDPYFAYLGKYSKEIM
jgi:hypothetical protein